MSEVCAACLKANPGLKCGACEEPVCKNCAEFLDNQTFSFYRKIPQELSHNHYCPSCHESIVVPALEKYNETMERAKEVYFFFVSQKRPPPILERAKKPIRIEECADRDETILRMGFMAAEEGFNGIVEAEVEAAKVRKGAYQTTTWKGTGVPVKVDAERLERHTRRH